MHKFRILDVEFHQLWPHDRGISAKGEEISGDLIVLSTS